MEMKDLSPWLIYSLGLLFVAGVALLILGVARAFAFDRRIQAENDREAARRADEILQQVGWKSKPLRQVSTDELEYVSILLSNFRMGRDKAWVRVQVGRTSVRAVIEYWWDTNYIERIWINMLARHFVKCGAEVIIRVAERQPYPEEIYIPDARVRNEADDPDPLSD